MRNWKLWGALALILALLGASFGMEYIGGKAQKEAARKFRRTLPEVDMTTVPDGTWVAEAGRVPYAYAVQVTVRDHDIVKVMFPDDADAEQFPRANELFERVEKADSLTVEPLAGANFESMMLLQAIGRALEKGKGADAGS